MPGIGVISNRNARLNKLNPELKDQLAYVIGSDGEVNSTSSITDAYKAAETFRRIGIDIIAISGGDGTTHRTLEILFEVYGEQPLPPILLLPTGTMNMVPTSFGIEGSGLANLLLAVARYRHNVPMRCIKRNLLNVNGHLSFMFGLGVAARFMVKFYERGQSARNPAGATKLLAQIVLDSVFGGDLSRDMSAQIPARITIDDVVQESKQFHVFFASFVERLPLHFELFPRCGRDEGVFEMAYSEASPLTIAAAMPKVLRGYDKDMAGVSRHLARKVLLELGHSEPYTLDGELYEPTDRFEISKGPELSFLIPALQTRVQDVNLRYDTAGPWSMRFLL